MRSTARRAAWFAVSLGALVPSVPRAQMQETTRPLQIGRVSEPPRLDWFLSRGAGGHSAPGSGHGGDLLLTYLVNPGTALYLGYTDQYENLLLSPGSPPTLERRRSPETSTGRQLFVKLSYLVRF